MFRVSGELVVAFCTEGRRLLSPRASNVMFVGRLVLYSI